MNKKNILLSLAMIAFLAFFSTSCTSDDLAFDVIESPVLAVFSEEMDAGMIRMTATFYELDKSGILDLNVGIDSTLITGLPVDIFINENNLVGTVTTDANGKATFEKTITELDGSSRLEWVGNYNSTPFRIYRNF